MGTLHGSFPLASVSMVILRYRLPSSASNSPIIPVLLLGAITLLALVSSLRPARFLIRAAVFSAAGDTWQLTKSLTLTFSGMRTLGMSGRSLAAISAPTPRSTTVVWAMLSAFIRRRWFSSTLSLWLRPKAFASSGEIDTSFPSVVRMKNLGIWGGSCSCWCCLCCCSSASSVFVTPST